MNSRLQKRSLNDPGKLVGQVADTALYSRGLDRASSASPLVFEHIAPPAQPFVAAVVARRLQRQKAPANVWIATPDVKSGERLHGEMAAWRAAPLFLPEVLPVDFEEALPDPDAQAERLAALQELRRANRDGEGCVLILPGVDLDEAAPPPASLETNTLSLASGGKIDLQAMGESLVEAGFEKVSQVFQRGQFAVRGGILDVFELHNDCPVRIELFDDEIDSIREFDIDQQTSIRKLDSVALLLDAGGGGGGTDPSSTLRDYLQPDDFVLGVECCPPGAQIQIMAASPSFDSGGEEDYSGACHGNPLGSFDAGDFILQQSRHDEFVKQTSEWERDGWQVWLASHSSGELERFAELLKETPIDPGFLQPFSGDLNQGFIIPDLRLAVLSGAEIFGRYQHQRARRKFSRDRARSLHLHAAQASEFSSGDLVVHADYGIGRYRGVQKTSADGEDRDAADPGDGAAGEESLVIEYADEARLYVPIDQAHLVSRYIGSGKKAPPLNRIGSKRWNQTRERAERSIRDYAAQLLSVHAERDSKRGFAHPADTKWQWEFENAFVYQETPDQLTCISATKEDMESERPMDRLICGDVGFGKTEIAIRAAFKAVMSGKQVAVLAPTTVLAQQHFQTFSERMSDFPITIDLLSRYRNASQQRHTIQQLRQGGVDIVIGTHRLISKDVVFKDLGLVVIDEEQRFGVKHKERFKQMFRLVDVLTLSATPIPRTLYLSLMGARDMSTIDTAPPNRFPVQTTVCPYDERLIRTAIERELKRQGQVYFLHNRVQSIEGVREKIEQLCPTARVAVGHGQMEEGELEKIMRRFLDGDIDVLVCTTIIESGLDIPNANTIIIDRADRFGLADLYQLRGRVGRADHRAYALLLLPRDMITEGDARKRINAIKQYSSLGAGFKIAMRDLEIRGAGNLLGTRQSGHIAAIGFDLYCQLLKQSVGKLKGAAAVRRAEVSLHIDFVATSEAHYLQSRENLLPAFLPAAYMPDSQLRIQAYRQLAEVASLRELRQVEQNWTDRFGRPPAPARHLLTCTELRLRAAQFGISAIEVRENKLMLTKNGAYLQTGGRFPRLEGKRPAKRLQKALELVKTL